MNIELAAAGALPALAAMYYVDRLDAARPEPRWLLRRMALVGGLAVVPCVIVQHVLRDTIVLGGVGGILFSAFVVAGLVEEFAKVLCLRLFIWKHPAFDERLDGIVYATRAGLGFAAVENVLYLLLPGSTSEQLATYVGRALLAVPGHAIYAGFMGYFAARKRFDRVGPGLLGGFVIGVLFHGVYDAMLFGRLAVTDGFLSTILLVGPIVVIFGGGLLLRHCAALALALDLRNPDTKRLRRPTIKVPIVSA